MSNVLPPNRTRLEAALAEACRADLVPEIIATLWHPDRCPAHVLPWLAWTYSVDEWRTGWPASAQREAIAASATIHRRKGTVWAVKRVLGVLNIRCDLKEWWQTNPAGQPHTFALTAWANENLTGSDAILSADLYTMLKRMVDDAKPVRSHYEFKVGARFDGLLRSASVTQTASVGRWSSVPAAVQPPPAINAIRAASVGATQALSRRTCVPSAVQPATQQLAILSATAAHLTTVVRISMESR